MAKGWIQEATKGMKKGALHKELGVPAGEKIPAKDLVIHRTDSELERERKQFALNMRKARGKKR